jgi:hypothetical protein
VFAGATSKAQVPKLQIQSQQSKAEVTKRMQENEGSQATQATQLMKKA